MGKSNQRSITNALRSIKRRKGTAIGSTAAFAALVAKHIGNLGGTGAPSATGTRRKRKSKRGRKGRKKGQLAGYKGKGRKVKRKGNLNYQLNKGVILTSERAVEQDSDNCVYIGHCSIPVNYGTQVVAMAFLKAICMDLGVNVDDFSRNTDGFNSGDRLYINYRVDSEAGTTESTQEFNFNSKTYISLAVEIAVFWQGCTEQVEFEQVYFQPSAVTGMGKRHWNMRTSRIMLTSTSTFKFQNRTVNSVGDEDAHEVDNVPLVGRNYFGPGTGTRYVGRTTGFRPFYADKYGLFAKTGDNGFSLREPPYGQLFDNCKRSGGLSINPGDIKTNVLKENIRMTFSRWLRSNRVVDYNGDEQPKGTLGHFNFYALEKAIGQISVTPVIVAAEQNLVLGCVFTLGKITYTTSVFYASEMLPDVVPE